MKQDPEDIKRRIKENIEKISARIRTENPIQPEQEKTPGPSERVKSITDKIQRSFDRLRAEYQIQPEPEKIPDADELIKRLTERINRSFDRIRAKYPKISEPVKTSPIQTESFPERREIALKNVNSGILSLNEIEEDLKKRFYQKLLNDLLSDNTKPFPTIICEMERPENLESNRKAILFSPDTKPFTYRDIRPQGKEGLEKKKMKTFGELYMLVNIN